MIKIGHRGACGHEPENTLISFEKAVALGVDWIEFDVQLSKDGHPVVIHDIRVNRTTNGNGRVKKLTLDQIKSLRTKKKEQPIPTLEEVLRTLHGKAVCNIELKWGVPIQTVYKVLKKLKIKDHIIISSGNIKTLKESKKLMPKVKTALVFRTFDQKLSIFMFIIFCIIFYPLITPTALLGVRVARPDYLHIHDRLISRRMIRSCRKRNIKINAWTVNKKGRMKKLQKLGVDGIFTNYPDRLVDVE